VAPSLHARISWKTTLHVLDSALVWGLRWCKPTSFFCFIRCCADSMGFEQ
jgi:hypothetical protein